MHTSLESCHLIYQRTLSQDHQICLFCFFKEEKCEISEEQGRESKGNYSDYNKKYMKGA